jgi:hypothetical protein
MKKTINVFILLVLIAAFQQAEAQKKRPAAVVAVIGAAENDQKGNNQNGGGIRIINAEQVMKIKIPEGGANGAAVIYHPKEKLYYAAQAGNEAFPLIIFDGEGNIRSEEGQATLIDVRGMWYNPKTKEIGGNGYKEFGWYRYELNKKGLPEKIDVFKQGRYQPDDHSSGVLNTDDNEVLFLNGQEIVCYTTDGKSKNKTIPLHIGQRTANDEQTDVTAFEKNYNIRSIIYTEIKGSEIGLLNINQKQVELYDIKTGYITQMVKLPIDFKPESFFNFSYSNGIYWVFDKENRNWFGYR